jgi:type III restriction enzyme
VSDFEVPTPILCSPYDEPSAHWWLLPDRPAERRTGRRPSTYWWKPKEHVASDDDDPTRVSPGTLIELKLVTLIRERLRAWRKEALAGGGGVTRTTCELMNWWRREGRQQRLFFAQLEAAETIVFLAEARADFRQGIDVPLDEPGPKQKDDGYRAFRRYACKMATGSGKTTVMAMLAAWSILNKVADRQDARFSDVVLAVCPNVTIKNRLAELDPALGDASLYRKRDLVPQHLMPTLRQGHVVVTNWHLLEPQAVKVGDTSARVAKAGRRVERLETIVVGSKVTSARGKRYMTPEAIRSAVARDAIQVVEQVEDKEGNVVRVKAVTQDYVESDRALVERVLGRDVGGKRNLLVFNDEAHHAYRIQEGDDGGEEDESDDDDADPDEWKREATVWIEGLDRIHKVRGINQCIDLSATPYFLQAAGANTNRIFPWVVSDFSLTDAIESGLVRIPQLAVRDTSGDVVPGYFNIWKWILPRLSAQERGGKRGSPKPEAILKWAHIPIAMLGGLWHDEAQRWAADAAKEGRTPVFILVCKNTKIAKVVYEWLAEDKPPYGIPNSKLPWFRNADGRQWTIRADTRVVHETDSGHAKSDEDAWMRATLDTVGKHDWPRDRQGRELYPEGFEALAKKLNRPLHPPGRDVRCIVSVGMLTEGWDCNSVTHIVGLRPFQSQLLCEQVVGRGLRRASYDVAGDGLPTEEIARVLGVPFEVIPFKESKGAPPKEAQVRHHVIALPERAHLAITFPRVEGYRQAIRNRVTVAWDEVAPLFLDAARIPPEVQMKATIPANQGRPSLFGPGRLDTVDLQAFRRGHRVQELAFDFTRDLVRRYREQPECTVPPHALFAQVLRIVDRYLREHVKPVHGTHLLDVFLAPYYGWVLERLLEAIRPDASAGEAPELPVYEQNRAAGSTADVEFWTGKDVRPVVKSHLNCVVADTKAWEQQAAYLLDRDPRVAAFAKNDHLGLAIPYLHDGQPHEYVPDFVVRLAGPDPVHLILETKGYDPLKKIKEQAARRWVGAVNADGRHGRWAYSMATAIDAVPAALAAAAGGGPRAE